MKLRSLSAFGLVLVLVASTAQADPPYAAAARVTHIEGALEAVEKTPPEVTQQGIEYAKSIARGACSAGSQRLRIECLMIALQKYCKDRGDAELPRCRFLMDVVASNVLADERLIPTEKRYRIMRDNKDYRTALARELRRIQGNLAVELRLATGDAPDDKTLAKNIDRYCLANADESSLPYQMCVSSLVWFIKGGQR